MSHIPKPRISVVTPSYNQSRFLDETLRSVLQQGYSNLEFIVIDGGSTDESVEIIKRYESHLHYWVSERDGGQSQAINKGFARCTGEIMTWLNSDDCLCPGALERVAAYFMTHPGVGAVIGDQEVVDADGRLVDVKKAVPVNYWLALHSACAVPQPATMFRRTAWLEVGPVDESLRYQMDFDFFLRMLKAGVRFGTIHQPIARFRLHADSKTVSSYDSLVSERTPLQDWRMRQLKHVARGALYLSRLVRRGSFAVYRNSRARQRAIR
jgi:glycosyltransferase involved in cell wall biosynthesis